MEKPEWGFWGFGHVLKQESNMDLYWGKTPITGTGRLFLPDAFEQIESGLLNVTFERMCFTPLINEET